MAGIVLVSGASGYIAGFTIRQLLAEGWQVRGTIRNLAHADRVRDTLGLGEAQLPLFAADLTRDDGWAEAAAGCTHMLHVASPLPASVPKDDEELVIPARDGALRALKAARAAGVCRVVMTSSVAAVTYGHDRAGRVFTEADWSNADNPATGAYARSKTIAERVARDWMAAHGAPMEFVTINPAVVLGPVLGPDFSTSLQLVKKLIDGAFPGIPRLNFSIVDVRDVADAHVKALTGPGLDGERFIVAGEPYWLEDVARILKERLGARAQKVPTRRLPDFMVRLSAFFDPQIRLVVPELGRSKAISSEHAKALLGIRFRPAEETIAEAANSLIDTGVVKA